MAGVISTRRVIGPISRDTGTARLLMNPSAGRPIRGECGIRIRALAGPGLVANHRVGCPITMDCGTPMPCLVGSGCRAHSGCGHRHWSTGMPAQGSGWLPAGCQYGTGVATVPTATLQRGGPMKPDDLMRVHSWEGRLTGEPPFQPHQGRDW